MNYMIKRNFCMVGVDPDFDDFILENKRFYLGLISNFKNKKYFYKHKNLGKENPIEWKKIKKKFNPQVIIAVDDGKMREKLKSIYGNNVINLIFQNSLVSPSTLKKIEKKKGILINKLAFVSSRVSLQDGVKIHVGSQIHHDVTIGKFVTLAPKSIILGGASIGDFSYIGAGSIIKQGIKIGKNCIVGAGSVVIRNIKDNSKVVGNPARYL